MLYIAYPQWTMLGKWEVPAWLSLQRKPGQATVSASTQDDSVQVLSGQRHSGLSATASAKRTGALGASRATEVFMFKFTPPPDFPAVNPASQSLMPISIER